MVLEILVFKHPVLWMFFPQTIKLGGNKTSEAAFEITSTGPTLYFRSPAIIAVTGGSFELKVNGSPCPMRRPVGIPAHSELKFGNRVNGVRAYLAVAGGFKVANIFLSKATNLTEGFGGYYGRALKRGDEIICSKPLGDFKKGDLGLNKPFLTPKCISNFKLAKKTIGTGSFLTFF